jgi:hypothetical protein
MNISERIPRFSRLGRHIRLCINFVLAGVTLPLVGPPRPALTGAAFAQRSKAPMNDAGVKIHENPYWPFCGGTDAFR